MPSPRNYYSSNNAGDEDVELVFEGGRPRARQSANKRPSPRSTPVDIDQAFDPFGSQDEDVDQYFDKVWDDEDETSKDLIYSDPMQDAVLNEGVHQIPGSPWAQPAHRPSTRPAEPLSLANYSSTLAFALTLGWVAFLFVMAVWNFSSIGRVIVEILLAIISFFGLFWNSYFTVSSIFKCFIPPKAFRANTKYCSLIPEKKPPGDKWLDVTIQIPVYKESLQEVLMPTLKSCMESRDHYHSTTEGGKCNIVVCDDGMMAFLKNNFAAAEMLWETIETTNGKIFKLSKILQKVPSASRRHLKGLSSKSVYEVFHRMLFYYNYNIGFVARSTFDRRGKFKKASNLNSHLRLYWGAEQYATNEDVSVKDALMQKSTNSDGSRFTMYGNDISIGHLVLVNDADARMAPSVIKKTVPEFLNDKFLGFTQHTTKTLDDQRGESYFINMLSTYTDALYQGHFLLSSILGCHPPLVGHSIFLRSEAVKQCGRIRTLRKTQRWLNNIGLPFLSVDQVGLNNLQDNASTEYWSENHVSEDFELMIHLYNLGFNGRYVAYPDCEFQEGITRTFDEEAGRHRKFALGAHELMFNPFNNWIGQGIFSPLFRTFLKSDIPSYYKIFLTAYLFSYTSGGAYLLVFSIAAILRILDKEDEVSYFSAFNSAGVLALSIIVYYVIGYFTFLISMIRMRLSNKRLLFKEYQDHGILYLIFMKIRYCMLFQLLFYSCMGNWFFLGSMDHMMSRSGIVSATNKDSIHISRCTALFDVIRFNSGSWFISFYMLALAYVTFLQDKDWDYTAIPDPYDDLYSLLFAAPAVLMAAFALFVPILLNPYVLGWPFNPSLCGKRVDQKKQLSKPKHKRGNSGNGSRQIVDLHTFMAKDAAQELGKEIDRIHAKPDVELGSLATHEFGNSKYPMSMGSPYGTEKENLFAHGRKNTSPNPWLERQQPERAPERRATSGGHNRTNPSSSGNRRPSSSGNGSNNKASVKKAMI